MAEETDIPTTEAPARCAEPAGSDADYLRAHGWKEASGMRDAWLDPKFRSIRCTDKAVEHQKRRDACLHPRLSTVMGKQQCIECGAFVNQNAPHELPHPGE